MSIRCRACSHVKTPAENDPRDSDVQEKAKQPSIQLSGASWSLSLFRHDSRAVTSVFEDIYRTPSRSRTASVASPPLIQTSPIHILSFNTCVCQFFWDLEYVGCRPFTNINTSVMHKRVFNYTHNTPPSVRRAQFAKFSQPSSFCHLPHRLKRRAGTRVLNSLVSTYCIIVRWTLVAFVVVRYALHTICLLLFQSTGAERRETLLLRVDRPLMCS